MDFFTDISAFVIETHIETTIENHIETHIGTHIETYFETHIKTHIETHIDNRNRFIIHNKILKTELKINSAEITSSAHALRIPN